MDNIHDLGGMHGFGPVPIESEGYTFKHEWQRRAFGLTQSLAGNTPFCADMHRHKIEQLSAVDYLQMDYFEKWTVATSELMKDAGLVDANELATGVKSFAVDLTKHPAVRPDDLVNAMKVGGDYTFPAESRVAAFQVNDTVRVLSNCPSGHTRVPRYVRGKIGTVCNVEDVFQFADAVAKGEGPAPQHCYLVLFKATDLWGEDAEAPDDVIYLDLAEAYLERA
ncbi:nitrile hydratase subunit beta [Cognatishimia sp. 1_MG-2023]|uniref:nitrile hydratase subunit beta n=1 Tax=Cognatishimia sp. 1_MG-2023 TaxID=3062642 RepID=UPI0026E119DB|nr:nitrile hydratase subunit beta [Cognatishimia sp. 1_MG-2023]MDO6728235.1 nitrile hydratase subunit beta [Cognatishimia sp. 1_MG-2023]